MMNDLLPVCECEVPAPAYDSEVGNDVCQNCGGYIDPVFIESDDDGEVATPPDFRKDLEALINSHSMENESETPDFILAEYLTGCLAVFDAATKRRDKWYGHDGLRAKLGLNPDGATEIR